MSDWTHKDFSVKVMENDPRLSIYTEVILDNLIVYSFKYQEDCYLPIDKKFELAQHILVNGIIHKDSNGLFYPSQPHIYLASCNGSPVSTMVGAANNSGDRFSEKSNTAVRPKCVCGSAFAGSNKHSSWCDIKEEL